MKQPDQTLSEFEQELAKAMARMDAPEGFAARVLERTEPVRKLAPLRVRMFPRHVGLWLGGAIAAGLLLAATVTEQVHRQHQRERADLAQQQFEAAIQITDHTLNHVRTQLQDAGIEIGD